MQNGLAAIVILDFSPRLENRCKLFPVKALLRALILKFKPRLENRCKLFPVYTLFRASILDFKPKLENRCKDFLVSGLLRASILDFRPRLENRCSAISATVRNGPPAVVVAATRSASDSILRCAEKNGSACSIVVGHLSLPQQRSASDSNLRCRNESESNSQRTS